MSNHETARAWIDVDTAAIRANFESVRRAVGDRTAIIPMVKANAYGLGVAHALRALDPARPWGYGVAAVAEGLELRALGCTAPVIVFTPIPPAMSDVAAEAGMIATISDLDGLARWRAAAARLGLPLSFHTEIDTGMGRAGFDWRDTPAWGGAVREQCGSLLRWAGVYTHFHGADSVDPGATVGQWERFKDAIAQLPVSREDLMVHAANSAGALRFPDMAGDAVRPGIYLYGGAAVDAGVAAVEKAQPVAAVRARILLVRDVPPGSTVGYGATHTARGWERWGTLGIGYGDGLPRALGNIGSALVKGKRAPIVGRVSMDMTVVDLTGIEDVHAGDVATLIGKDGGAEITVDEVAAAVGTISYEILTGFTPRLPRVEATNA